MRRRKMRRRSENRVGEKYLNGYFVHSHTDASSIMFMFILHSLTLPLTPRKRKEEGWGEGLEEEEYYINRISRAFPNAIATFYAIGRYKVHESVSLLSSSSRAPKAAKIHPPRLRLYTEIETDRMPNPHLIRGILSSGTKRLILTVLFTSCKRSL